jgi:hypothetical protein
MPRRLCHFCGDKSNQKRLSAERLPGRTEAFARQIWQNHGLQNLALLFVRAGPALRQVLLCPCGRAGPALFCLILSEAVPLTGECTTSFFVILNVVKNLCRATGTELVSGRGTWPVPLRCRGGFVTFCLDTKSNQKN